MNNPFFNNRNQDLISAIINTFGTLGKLRPSLLQFIVEALSNWTPAKLAGESATKIRSSEKAVAILLGHILRQVKSRGVRAPYIYMLKFYMKMTAMLNMYPH